MFITTLAVVISLQGAAIKPPTTEVDPNLLSIGRKGKVSVSPGQIVNTASGLKASVEEVAAGCVGSKFLFLGENHATKAHQDLQAEIIRALVKRGMRPIVGLEMFQRPKQDVLDLWSAGSLSEDQFLLQSEWKTQWGYDYGFYRPVFEAIKENHLPLVGLNVPRDWVRTTGKTGFKSLRTSARIQLPDDLDLTNGQHRQVFESLMGGHQMAGPSMNNMYSAQVLWDEGMADTAMKYVRVNPLKSNEIFVVIAGSGHVMYGQGINYRIQKRGRMRGKTLVMTQSDMPAEVSKGIGDWVFVSVPVAKANNTK